MQTSPSQPASPSSPVPSSQSHNKSYFSTPHFNSPLNLVLPGWSCAAGHAPSSRELRGINVRINLTCPINARRAITPRHSIHPNTDLKLKDAGDAGYEARKPDSSPGSATPQRHHLPQGPFGLPAFFLCVAGWGGREGARGRDQVLPLK